MSNKKRRKTPPPPVVVEKQTRSAVRLLTILAALLFGAALVVVYAKYNPTEAGIKDYFDRYLSGEQPTGDPALDEMLAEEAAKEDPGIMKKIFGPDLVSPEEAASFEELFNQESTAIHDDLIEDAEFHSEQIECLVKAIYFEAAKEPELGKRWVFDVITNRVKQQYRGKQTYCDVIYDYRQFSFANLTKDRVPDNNRFLIESRDVVLDLYGDPDHRDITCGATHYLNVEEATDLSWYKQALEGTSPEGLTVLAKVGNHTFLGPEGGCN